MSAMHHNSIPCETHMSRHGLCAIIRAGAINTDSCLVVTHMVACPARKAQAHCRLGGRLPPPLQDQAPLPV